MLQIKLLGQPRFSVDGQAFKFSAPVKALALLAYLLLNRNVPVARDSLAFMLWPDETEDDARTKLRYHLNYLKSALPPSAAARPWLLADADSVQWNPAAEVSFDVAEFEDGTADAASRAQAVELYGGDLLENLYDDWLFPQRERLRGLFIDSMNALLLESRSRRDFPKAINYGQRILSIDLWREDAVRQIMSVRYDSGDRAGALHEYEKFALRLREEMDVEPMPDTVALRDLIARNAPVSDIEVPEAAALEDRRPAPLLPLVGREPEVDQLRALWTRAAHGHGGATLISGEAGIGKSRLASELALLVAAQGGRVLMGSTLNPESVPYQPIADAFRSAIPLLTAVDAQPIWLSAVGQIVPELRARRTDLPPLAMLDPSRERLRLFESMAACLSALANTRPVLVVLEDLHWAGEATLSAFEFLARRSVAQPVLMIGTYRTEETRAGQPLRALRRRLQREGSIGHIDLARLSESAVRDLFLRVPDLAARGEPAAAAAYAESEGNPLYLNVVIRDMLESPAREAQPRGLMETIHARVARLSERAEFVAQTASVVGTAFDVDTVNEITGWPESETLVAVDELVEHHLVRETGRRAAFDYAFAHHLVQSAVYDSIDPEARVRWHKRAARAIESIHADSRDGVAAVVAHHFDRSGDTAEAAQRYLVAARNAHAVFAEDEALAHARRGLELSSDSALTYELLALQESLYHRLGQRPEQSEALNRLEAIARGSQDPGVLCAVFDRRVTLHRILGEREQERSWMEALAETARAADARWQTRALLARANYEIRAGDAEKAREHYTSAAALAATHGDHASEAESLCELAYIGTMQGRTADGDAAMAKAEAAAKKSGDQALLARTLFSASTAAVVREDFAQGQDYARRALDLYRLIGDREGEADCCERSAMAAARQLLVSSAQEWYGKARALYAELGKRRGQAAVSLNSGVLAFMVGLLDESIAACQEAQRIFLELDDLLGVTLSTLNMGMAKYTLGEYAEAKQLSQTAVELARKVGSKRAEASALGNLGVAERELGELKPSIDHLLASLELRELAGGGPDGVQDLAELAITYARAGDNDRALEIANKLMALDERSFETASTPQIVPWAATQVYRAAGRRKRAKEAETRWRALVARRLVAMPENVRASYERLPFNQNPT